jgi:predicted MPP superfamily phosphohydrolase
MIVFFIFLGLLIGIDVYAFFAFKAATIGRRKAIPFAYAILSVSSLLLLFMIIFLRIEQISFDATLQSYSRGFLFIIYFSKFIIVLPLILDDFRRIILFAINYFRKNTEDKYMPDRSAFLSKMGLILGGIPAFLLTYGMVRNPFRFQLRSQSIPIENLPIELDGLKIVQISDLHSGTFSSSDVFEEAIKLVNGQNPDVVVFTGDLVNSVATEADAFIEAFSRIKSRLGTFSILGNHDYGDYVQWSSEREKKENFDELLKQHERLGWTLLRDESRQIEIKGCKINFLGVNNISALSNFPKYGDLEKTWSNAEEADINILLSHDPTHWNMEVTKSFPDIQLTLSGHTHGFQFGIEIPGFVKWSPSQWVYNQWAGLYKTKNQYLYVNRGLGCLGYPGRVGILPEVTSIKLTRP